MENYLRTYLVILICITYVQADYLDGLKALNIDQNLINQANSAITDLKHALQQNIKCRREQENRFDGGWNLRGHRLLWQEGERHIGLRGAHGIGEWFTSQQPMILCESRQQSGVFSGLYKKVMLVSELLNKVKSYIVQYNNIILGNGNAVSGTSNVVIGSRNSLTGSNDWVFASDYKSNDPQEGVLIIEVYLIELTDLMKISYNPKAAIHCIKQEDSNTHWRSFWHGERESHRAAF